MSELNCMFQYGTSNEMIADTGLLSQSEAVELFNKNKQDFIERLENNENPQMALWVNCKTNQSYGETLYNWYADDFKFIDGELYQKVDI